jgi:hypothetical protein
MALVASGALCACAIAVGALNAIAPVLTMFFLMCYTCVNFSCFMSEVLSDPNWRPRFRYYHWAQSLFGTVLCIWMMFALSAIYAMIAMIFAACVFLYASYHSSKVKWGDGFQGMKFQVARNILMHLDLSTHTKNWRPQVLVVTKASAPVGGGEQDSRPETVVLEDPELVTFASQLKGGRGITIIGGICSSKPSGLFNDNLFLDQRQRQNLKDGQMAMKQMLHDNEIQGFGRVVYTDDFSEGLLCMVQTCGIGAFQPNCILASWPTNWDAPGAEGVKVRTEFVRLVQASVVFQKVVLLSNNQTVPALTTRLGGTIDIWWVVADGGILLLLPFLLKKHPVWRRCRTRLFAVADKINDDVTEMQRELEAYVNDFRLDVEVHVKVIDPEDGTASGLTKNPVSFSNWRRVAANPESARGLNEDCIRAHSNPEVRFPRLLQTHESSNEENEITGQKRSFSAADAIDKAQKDSDDGSFDNVCANSGDVMLNLPHAKDKKAFPMVAPTGLGKNLARDLSENCDQNFTSITIDGPQVSKDQVGEPAISGGDISQTVNIHRDASFIHSTDQMESNVPLSAGELALGRALNRAMLSESGKAELIVTNLPDMPTAESALGYFQLVDELTRDLPRCLLVRGTQLEVITAFT